MNQIARSQKYQICCHAKLVPGWHVVLCGDLSVMKLWARDGSCFEYDFASDLIGPPIEENGAQAWSAHDPVAGHWTDGCSRSFFLTTNKLSKASDADEAITLSRRIIDDLNIDMAMFRHSLPISCSGVVLASPSGSRNYQDYIWSCSNNSIKEPRISLTKEEYNALSKREKVRALLYEFSGVGGYDGIYKTLELSQQIVGKNADLSKLCPTGIDYKNFRAFVNRYRHAVTDDLKVSFTRPKVHRVLRKIVETALKYAQ